MPAPHAAQFRPHAQRHPIITSNGATLPSQTIHRPKPAFKSMLQLATKVVRGLFAKLVPPPAPAAGQPAQLPQAGAGAVTGEGAAGAAAAAAGMQGAAGAEGEEGAAAVGAGGEAEAERAKRSASLVSGMLFVDLLFWKSASVAEEIKDHYHIGPGSR